MQEEEPIDEEEENDKVQMPEKLPEHRNLAKVPKFTKDGDDMDLPPILASTRYRSRSENLNNGSIFKFMENTLCGRTDPTKANFLF